MMALRCPIKRKRSAGSVTDTTTGSPISMTDASPNIRTSNIDGGAGGGTSTGISPPPFIMNEDATIGSSNGVNICSIRDDDDDDDDEPRSRQSSLLSFFVKKKVIKSKNHKKSSPTDSSTNTSTCNIIQDTNTNLSSTNVKANTSKSTRPISATASSALSSRSSSPQKKKKKSLTQVYIDCGQSQFGQILCNTCGMLYMPGIVEDENQHKKLCQAYTQGIPCVRGNIKGGRHVVAVGNNNNNNNKGRTVQQQQYAPKNGDTGSDYDSATIVLWRPPSCSSSGNNANKKNYKNDKKQDPNTCTTNTNVVPNKHIPSQWPLLAQMISKDLGTHEQSTLDHINNNTVLLYLGNATNNTCSTTRRRSNNNNIINKHNQNGGGPSRILGAVTVQFLSEAYRMISHQERSLTPERAKLGIGLLWTHPVARHKGIATRLVHTARDHSIFGMRIARSDIAFSSPTQAGYDFALHYYNDIKNCNDNSSSNKSNDEKGYNNKGGKNNDEQQQQKENVSRTRPLVYEMHL